MIDASVETQYPFIAEQRGTFTFASTSPADLVQCLPTAHASRVDVFIKQTRTTVGDRISDVTLRTYSQGREIYIDTQLDGDVATGTASFVVTGIIGETTDILVTSAHRGFQNVVTCWAVARS